MHKRKFLLFILLFLTVITFRPTYSKAQAANSIPTETRSITDNNFDDSKALSILYDRLVPGKKEARWIMPNDIENSRKEHLFLFPGKEVVTTVLQSVPYIEGGRNKVLFLTKTRPEDFTCSACSPLIGGAIFNQTEHGWSLGPTNKFITSMGDTGEVRSLGNLVKIGNDNYGIIFNLGGCGQGTCYAYNVLIGEAGGKLEELLWIEKVSGEYSDCYNCEGSPECDDCWSFKSIMNYIPIKGNKY